MMKFEFLHQQIVSNEVTYERREISDFSLVELNYSPNVKVSAHAHEQANFSMIIEGGSTEVYAAKAREYKPFMLEFLPPHQTHSFITSRKKMRAFSINISPQCLDRIREDSLKADDSVFCAGGPLIHLMTKLYDEFQNMDAASPLIVEGLALEMLGEVSRHQFRESVPPRWLKQARDILHEQFSLHLSLDAIAQEVGVHSVSLARAFRRHYHCTLGEYVRKIKVEYACQEMANSETPLLDIALTAGFSDQSHFSRIFKRIKGMTPYQYRNKLKVG